MDTFDTVRALGNDHAILSDGIDRLARRLMAGFRTLTRRQFDAPWRGRRVAR